MDPKDFPIVAGDVFKCNECGMALQITADCKCDDDEVDLTCCGNYMAKQTEKGGIKGWPIPDPVQAKRLIADSVTVGGDDWGQMLREIRDNTKPR